MGNVSSLKNDYELGYDGEKYLQQEGIKYFLLTSPLKDNGLEFADPPVPDGEGFDVDGKDSMWATVTSDCRIRPGITKHQFDLDRYYKNPSIKNIMEHWDISKEHPGMSFTEHYATGHDAIAENDKSFNYVGLVRRLGPGYLDHKDGEYCHEKIFAATKYALYFSGWVWFYRYYLASKDPSPLKLIHKTYPIIAVPVASAAATWAGVTCVSCFLRGKDDRVNYFLGGLAAGFPVYVRTNRIFYGVSAAAYLGLASVVYKTLLHLPKGVIGNALLPEFWPTAIDWKHEWMPFHKMPNDEFSCSLRETFGIKPPDIPDYINEVPETGFLIGLPRRMNAFFFGNKQP